MTVGFSFDDEPKVNSQDELRVATSTICPITHHPLTPSSAEEGSYFHNLSRPSNCNLCACSFPPCATRSPGRGRACPTLPGSAAMYAEGTASRPPTAKGLAYIGIRPGSAGHALRPLRSAQGRPCGSSSGAGSCRAAVALTSQGGVSRSGAREKCRPRRAGSALHLLGRAAKPASRWKSRPSADGLEGEPCAKSLLYKSLANSLNYTHGNYHSHPG